MCGRRDVSNELRKVEFEDTGVGAAAGCILEVQTKGPCARRLEAGLEAEEGLQRPEDACPRRRCGKVDQTWVQRIRKDLAKRPARARFRSRDDPLVTLRDAGKFAQQHGLPYSLESVQNDRPVVPATLHSLNTNGPCVEFSITADERRRSSARAGRSTDCEAGPQEQLYRDLPESNQLLERLRPLYTCRSSPSS